MSRAEDTGASTDRPRADAVADVVVVGAGGAGLPAAIVARDRGASVVVVEANHDVGGHAMLSGGTLRLGGGNSLQARHGIADSPDLVYLDLTDHRNPQFRRSDRDLARVFADQSVASFEFLLENGVVPQEGPPQLLRHGTIPRAFVVRPWSTDWNETINGTAGSGVVRALEASARRKGVTFLLRHELTRIVRDGPAGRVVGVVAQSGEREVFIGARGGVVLATGGHTSNVEFRRMFDPRLTEEYQTAGEPWTKQNADGERLALDIGAGLWGTAIQTTDSERTMGGGTTLTKTRHIGCRCGYLGLKWDPRSPVFHRARASGLTVSSFQDLILVNQVGLRFWDETDDSMAFVNACFGTNGNLGAGGKANGGGPIWAIFDANAVERERWVPEPPHVDPDGWFFSADTIAELAARIVNPHQRDPMPAAALEETVERWNLCVETGEDVDFGRPTPPSKAAALARRILAPPFYAAWATPMLHDSLTGLRVDARSRVIDRGGRVIAGLYCAGETAGGFGLHGLARAVTFGRIAGHEAAGEAPRSDPARP